MDDRTVHYRPQMYWQAGTQVTVDAKVYGMNLGDGMFGETDRTLNLTIGPAKIATVDDATKIMTVTIDGQVARQFPVSMDRDESITVAGQVITYRGFSPWSAVPRSSLAGRRLPEHLGFGGTRCTCDCTD